MKWIDVNDKLPDKIKDNAYSGGISKEVIVLLENNKVLIASYSKGEFSGGDQWEQWYCEDRVDALSDVTYWCDCIPNH